MVDNPAEALTHTAVDTHVHTKLCHHASGEMEDYVLAAIKRGLAGIVFLEHMEEGIDATERTWLTEEDFDYYFTEGKRLQKKYRDKLTIGLGVECGYNPECPQTLISRLASREWDEIGISCHFIKPPGSDTHINLFSRKSASLEMAKKNNPEHLLNIYFDTLLEAVNTMPGTILCHLDGALRFLPGTYLTNKHLQKIRQLLIAVQNNKMSVEVNCSGIVIRGEQFPADSILKMVISHKIPLVLGSDAHKPEDVGQHFSQVEKLISAAPFS